MYVSQIGGKSLFFPPKLKSCREDLIMLMTRSVPFGVDMRVITRQIYHLFFQTV